MGRNCRPHRLTLSVPSFFLCSRCSPHPGSKEEPFEWRTLTTPAQQDAGSCQGMLIIREAYHQKITQICGFLIFRFTFFAVLLLSELLSTFLRTASALNILFLFFHYSDGASECDRDPPGGHLFHHRGCVPWGAEERCSWHFCFFCQNHSGTLLVLSKMFLGLFQHKSDSPDDICNSIFCRLPVRLSDGSFL